MILYNDDTCSLRYVNPPHTVETLRRALDHLRGTQVDTLCWLLGTSIAYSWPSKVWDHYYDRLAAGCVIGLFDDEVGFDTGSEPNNSYLKLPPGEEPRNVMLSLHRQGIDYLPLLIEETRKAGLRFYGSFRMNDCHLKSDPDGMLSSRFWRENQHLRLWEVTDGRTYYNAALDYSYPQVREYYLSGICEVLQWYDLDGLELDFCRNPYLFQPSCGWEQRGILTDFLRQIKTAVNAAEERLGHKVDLQLRLPFCPKKQREAGMEIQGWIKERLADRIVMSALVNDYTQKLEPWLSLCREHGIGFFPSIEQGPAHAAPAHNHITIESVEETIHRQRGAAQNFLSQGAGGVYLFNYPCLLHQVRRTPEAFARLTSIFSQIGTQETLKGQAMELTFWQELPMELESYRPPQFHQTLRFHLPPGSADPDQRPKLHFRQVPDYNTHAGFLRQGEQNGTLPHGWVTYLLNDEELAPEAIVRTPQPAGRIASGFDVGPHEAITLVPPRRLLRDGENTLSFHIRRKPERDDPYVLIYELIVSIPAAANC